MAKLGLNAKLYRNTGTYASPTWSELKNVRDLSNNDSMEEADTTTRGSGGFTEQEPTLRAVELEFDMVNKPGDTDLTAMRTAYINRQEVELAVMDGDITTSGSTGVRATFKIFEFGRNQDLRNAQMIAVKLKPSLSENPPEDMTIA